MSSGYCSFGFLSLQYVYTLYGYTETTRERIAA